MFFQLFLWPKYFFSQLKKISVVAQILHFNYCFFLRWDCLKKRWLRKKVILKKFVSRHSDVKRLFLYCQKNLHSFLLNWTDLISDCKCHIFGKKWQYFCHLKFFSVNELPLKLMLDWFCHRLSHKSFHTGTTFLIFFDFLLIL